MDESMRPRQTAGAARGGQRGAGGRALGCEPIKTAGIPVEIAPGAADSSDLLRRARARLVEGMSLQVSTLIFFKYSFYFGSSLSHHFQKHSITEAGQRNARHQQK